MNIRPAIKAVMPAALLSTYRHYKNALNGRRSAEAVFTQVYLGNQWGGDAGTFFSGAGSRDIAITQPYVAFVQEWLRAIGADRLTLLDLGCGDFTIGSQLAGLCGSYIGVDVVADLVKHNQASFTSEKVHFVQLDVTKAPLPAADICVVRQVLQHLSNAEIRSILPKLARYRWVLITEGYPPAGKTVRPNVDIPHGAGTRLARSSGVFLDEAPFGVERSRLSLLHEVDSPSPSSVLRTYLYTPTSS